MKWLLKIEVGSKPGTTDPEGETTADVLKELGYRVESVKVGKVYRVILDAESKTRAHAEAVEMCKRLLANPTKDDYEIAIEEK
jgi:phosphoribosylformylglycinamidine synthase PurS subunit